MKEESKLARQSREEHDEREGRRKAKKKLRGFTKKPSIPRSIRAHRATDKQSP